MGRMLGGSSYALAGGDYDLHYILKKVDCTNCILPDAIGIFQYMPSLEELVLTNADTSNMTTMRYMFAGARNLKSLDLSSFDTSNVTDMYNMFYGDKLLEEINFSGWDTSKVKDTEEMFRDTFALKTLDLSSWDVSSITSLRGMFTGTGATTGYAKDQETVEFFNNLAPSTLRFTVKQ
jgi:surface protein